MSKEKIVPSIIDDSLVMIALMFLILITVYFSTSNVPDPFLVECSKKGIIDILYCRYD